MNGMDALDKAIASTQSPMIRRGLEQARCDLSLAAQGEGYRIRMWAIEQARGLMREQRAYVYEVDVFELASQLERYAAEGEMPGCPAKNHDA